MEQLTLKDFNKVLLQYKRDNKGNIQGMVVSIGRNILGWSLCNAADKFDKAKGISIALRRAQKSSTLTLMEKEEYYLQIPQSLLDLAETMINRSKLYFTI